MKYNRVFLIVCDSLGIGNAKDANLYNDEGSNTLKHICNACNGLDLPNLEGLGLGSLGNFSGIHQLTSQLGYTLALNEISNGKDTMKNHLLHLPKPAFLKNLLNFLKKKLGVNVLAIRLQVVQQFLMSMVNIR